MFSSIYYDGSSTQMIIKQLLNALGEDPSPQSRRISLVTSIFTDLICLIININLLLSTEDFSDWLLMDLVISYSLQISANCRSLVIAVDNFKQYAS